MNIILGDSNADVLRDKYVVLTLDSFQLPNCDDKVTAYCVVEHVPLEEMTNLESWKSLHENLMINYSKRHWSFCEQAIEHLMGRWNRELDTFYTDLFERISQAKIFDASSAWSPIINRKDTDDDSKFFVGPQQSD